MAGTPHILLLGDDSPMRPVLWEAGAETSVICDTATARTHRSLTEHQSVIATDEVDVREYVELAAGLHRSRPITRAYGVDDSTTVAAAAINKALGVPDANPPATAEASVDKALYRRRLLEAGVDGIRGIEAACAEEIVRFGDEVGWPVVVKPAVGSGSTGATVGVSREDAGIAWERARMLSPDTPSGRVVVEQQASGKLLTVDTHSHHGSHRLVMVGFELITPDRPVVVLTGAPAPISTQEWDQAVTAAFAALDALGVVEGPAHTEVFLSDTGPVVIETQLRFGGDFPQLTRAATGLDPYQVCVAGWTGQNPHDLIDASPVDPRDGTPSVMLWGGPNCSGEYLTRHGLPTEAEPGVEWVHEIGRPPRRIGPVEVLEALPVGALCSARTTRRAVARAKRALADVRFRIAPDPQLPAMRGVS